MKHSSRTLLKLCIVVAGAIFVCLAFVDWRSGEPRYQGKRLSTWMNDLTAEPQNLSESEALAVEAQRREMLTNVVRAIGSDGLPFYLDWIQSAPQKPSPYERLEDWLTQKTRNRIRLPQRQYRAVQAFTAIQILGPSAKSAVSPLERLLNNESSCDIAARCLAAIGPDSVPALSNALTSTNDRVRNVAARALGDLGVAAKPSRPELMIVIKTEKASSSPGLSTTDLALRALAEIDSTADELLALFQAQLFATNASAGAAYGLVRLGATGTPILNQAVTNEDAKIRASAEAALDLLTYLKTKDAATVIPFDHFNVRFNNRLVHAVLSKGSAPHDGSQNPSQ